MPVRKVDVTSPPRITQKLLRDLLLKFKEPKAMQSGASNSKNDTILFNPDNFESS